MKLEILPRPVTKYWQRLPARMTTSDTANVLPEIAAAEGLRQHLQEIADERDRAHRALQEREAELVRISAHRRCRRSRNRFP